jgi:hypothetical protein
VSDARIKSTGDLIHVCEECEAAWPTGVLIAFDSFEDLASLLKSKGLIGIWDELDVTEG